MKSRIEWTLKATEVAQEFLNHSSEGEVQGTSIPQTKSNVDESAQAQLYQHVFLLRPGVQVSIALPLDLTSEEAFRLSEFIQALPFRIEPIVSTTS